MKLIWIRLRLNLNLLFAYILQDIVKEFSWIFFFWNFIENYSRDSFIYCSWDSFWISSSIVIGFLWRIPLKMCKNLAGTTLAIPSGNLSSKYSFWESLCSFSLMISGIPSKIYSRIPSLIFHLIALMPSNKFPGYR